MKSVLAWAGAGLLFVAGALSVLDADTRDEGASYAAGAVVGRAFAALLIALLLRAGYVWIRRRQGAQGKLWSPWALVIAGIVALVAGLGSAGGDDEGSAGAESSVGDPPPAMRTSE